MFTHNVNFTKRVLNKQEFTKNETRQILRNVGFLFLLRIAAASPNDSSLATSPTVRLEYYPASFVASVARLDGY